MIHTLFHFLRFLAQFAWFIWPVSLMADIVISEKTAPGKMLHLSRWALRILHSLTMVAFVMIYGVEFFWIEVVKTHYHGGKEILVVGPLVLYISIRLAQQLDAKPSQADKSVIHSTLALLLPATSAALLLTACISEIAGPISILADRNLILIFVVPLLSLIAVGSLSRCKVRLAHVILVTSLAMTCFLLTIIFFVAAECQFFGFLPWGHANDDPWFYVLAGLVCFTILSITSFLKSE